MSKVRVKSIKKDVINNEGLNAIMSQLVGQDRNNPNVPNAMLLWDQYKQLDKLCFDYIGIMLNFNKIFLNYDYDNNLVLYVNDFIHNYKSLFCLNNDLYKPLNGLGIPPGYNNNLLIDLRNKVYDVRDSLFCKNILITCGNIKDTILVDKNNTTITKEYIQTVLRTMTAVDFKAFPNSQFDVKYLWDRSDLTIQQRDGLVKFVYDIFTKGMEIYDVITTPSVDVDELFNALMGQFSMFEKDLHDCREAFDLIKKSTHIFKDRFKSYYKKFLASGNQTNIILEEYLGDIVKTAGDDSKLITQIRKLMLYVKKKVLERMKQANGTAQSAQMNDMMKKMEAQVDKFEKIFDNLDSDNVADETTSDIKNTEDIISKLGSMLGDNI